METFVLVTWLWVGQRYEEVRIPGLVASECQAQMRKLWRSYNHSRFMIPEPRPRDPSYCLGSNGKTLPTISPSPICAYGACGNTLPAGHKRARIGLARTIALTR